MNRVALATVILSAVALTAEAQATRLSGRVLADETGDPVPNARVLLTSPASGPSVLTDRDGRFTLATPSGPVTVAATKTGYSRREAMAAAAGLPIEIRLIRGAVISGRVIDALGDPIVGGRVLAEVTSASKTGFTVAAAADTDDRGEYRLGSLQPDTFRVAVITMGAMTRQAIGPNPVTVFPTVQKTYYPDAATPEAAQGLRVEAADDRSAIDFVLPAGSNSQRFIMMPASPLARAQAPDPSARPTGVIRGRVVTTDRRALPHAQVRLLSQRTPFQSDTATSDDDGRFEFRNLAPGSFRIAARKVGYSAPGEALSLGPPGPGLGVSVDLAEGEIRARTDITLARWGTLSGHVFDELGDPLQGVSVQLLQVRYQNGRRRLVPAGGAARVTDDLGRFRTYGLAPGRYIVSAAAGDIQSAELPGYARSYFPGTPVASEAQFVSMGPSQEVTAIDFSMARARTVLIAGKLLNAAGEPTTGGNVRLMPSQRAGSVVSVPIGARILPDGRFEFPNVTPGQYVIQADRGRRNSSTEGEFGALPVAVDGNDVTGLMLQTSSGSSIAGRITFDSFLGAAAPRRGQIEISPIPVDPDQSPMSPATADIGDDWTFAIAGVNGPRRLQMPRAPTEWTLRAIRVRGIDVTDRPLAFGHASQSLTDVEVVLTDRINEVGGTVVDDHARPAIGAHVVVFAVDRDRWYPASRFLRHTAATAEGTIALFGLPPGSYYAAAVAQLPADGDDAWQDPAYLESLIARAAAFSLGEGQKQIVNLKLP